jgi:hypothetical protein
MESTLQPLTRADLQQFILRFEESSKGKGFQPRLVERSFNLACNILHHFMGEAWVVKNVRERDAHSREERSRNTPRVLHIAEALFNLQDNDGLPRLIEESRGDLSQARFEAFVSETEVGKMLHAAGIPFLFVKPRGKQGDDYDIEICFPTSWKAAAEIKCKVETTRLTELTVTQAIDRARGQLPADKPGFVFMKVPDAWSASPKFEEEIRSALGVGLRQVCRITTVFVWWKGFTKTGGYATQDPRLLEVPNPMAQLGPGPIQGLAKLTWQEAGQWTYLNQLIKDTLNLQDDGTVVRITHTP